MGQRPPPCCKDMLPKLQLPARLLGEGLAKVASWSLEAPGWGKGGPRRQHRAWNHEIVMLQPWQPLAREGACPQGEGLPRGPLLQLLQLQAAQLLPHMVLQGQPLVPLLAPCSQSASRSRAAASGAW